MPAVKEDRNVMVPMQKDKRLFVNDNKECVNELSVYLIVLQAGGQCGLSRNRVVDSW